MADPTVKIVNLTKVVDGKTNRITVTDTDGDFGGSIMGFDKNDKVVVKGDVSVFTQDEIKNAFLKNYTENDSRTDADLKDSAAAKLEMKNGKIAGDTSKAFRLGDLAKVANPVVKNDAANINPGCTFANPQVSMQTLGLMNMATAFLGSPMLMNFGEPYSMAIAMNPASMTSFAKYLWDSVQVPSNPFTSSQTTPAATEAGAKAAASTPAAAVVSEGEIKDETAKGTTTTPDGKVAGATTTATTGAKAEGAKAEGAKAAADDKASKADKASSRSHSNVSKIKGTKFHKGEEVITNKAGQKVKKYTDASGNRVIEAYKDGKLVQTDTYYADGRVKSNYADGKTRLKNADGSSYIYTKDKKGNKVTYVYDAEGNYVKTFAYDSKAQKGSHTTYEKGQVVKVDAKKSGGKKVTISDYAGNSIENAYNAKGTMVWSDLKLAKKATPEYDQYPADYGH